MPLMLPTDLGTWDYYVMSDATSLWYALNGLASWMTASGGLLQAAAGLGAVICLALILFNTAIGQKSGGGSVMIGGWFFIMSMMAMTGTAQVVNIYTGATTTVNNVPALALIPASVFSKASYKVFTGMETAFSASSGSYMSVKANGFVGPLDLLLTLRSDNFAMAQPGLMRSLRQVVADCGIPSAGYPAATPSMQNSLDILDWLKTNGEPVGITRIYAADDANGNGDPATCLEGLTYLDTSFTALAAGNPALVKFINTNANKSNPMTGGGNWGSSSITNSHTMLVGAIAGVTQSAEKFTKNALVSSAVSGTISCLSNSGMLTSADTCATSSLANAEGVETWKTAAAMKASGFVKLMFTSMGFLQVLFFSLFPFIALYGLIVVNKTMVVFGSYILLGIWSQSWMLVVVPIQAYIQNNVIDELTRVLSGSGGLTMANQAAVYTMLSDKLAVASDMMASSQMLALALLSGSIYSLSSLVGQSGGAQSMDPGSVQKKMTNSTPVVQGESATRMAQTIVGRDGGTASQIYGSTDASVSGGIAQIASASRASGTGVATQDQAAMEKSRSFLTTELAKMGYSVEESSAIAQRISSALGTTGTVNSALLGVMAPVISGLQSKDGKPLSAEEKSATMDRLTQSHAMAVEQLATGEKGWWAKFNSEDATERNGARLQAAMKAIDIAGDASMVFAAGAVVASAGTLTGPALAGAAAIQAGKKTLISQLKSGMANVASKELAVGAAGATAATAGRQVLGKVASGFGQAILGDANVVGKAAHDDAFSENSEVGAKKGFGRDSNASAGVSAAVKDTQSLTRTKSFDQSASDTNTSNMTLTHTREQLGARFLKSPQERAQNLENEKTVRAAGAANPERLAAADRLANTAMGSYEALGAGGEETTAAVRAHYFVHYATNDGYKNAAAPGPRANPNQGGADTPLPPEPKEPVNAPTAKDTPQKQAQRIPFKKPEDISGTASFLKGISGQSPQGPDNSTEARVANAAANLTRMVTGSAANAVRSQEAVATSETFVATAGRVGTKPAPSSLERVTVSADPNLGMGAPISDMNQSLNKAKPNFSAGEAAQWVLKSSGGVQVNFANGAAARYEKQVQGSSSARDILWSNDLAQDERKGLENRNEVVDTGLQIIGGVSAAQSVVKKFTGDSTKGTGDKSGGSGTPTKKGPPDPGPWPTIPKK